MFNDIFFAGGHSPAAFATTALALVITNGCALDIVGGGDCNAVSGDDIVIATLRALA